MYPRGTCFTLTIFLDFLTLSFLFLLIHPSRLDHLGCLGSVAFAQLLLLGYLGLVALGRLLSFSYLCSVVFAWLLILDSLCSDAVTRLPWLLLGCFCSVAFFFAWLLLVVFVQFLCSASVARLLLLSCRCSIPFA